MAAYQKHFQRSLNINSNIPLTVTPANTPAFILCDDIGEIDGYVLSQKIMQQIGNGFVDCVQQVRNLWRIYLTTKESKIDLVTQGVSIDGKAIKVHNQNPFVTGAIHNITSGMSIESVDMVRVLIKDLYKSVSTGDIEPMLTDVYGVKLSSAINYGYYRDKHRKLSTNVKNGDRIVWVHPDQLETPLPRFAQCGTQRCRIFHRNQFDGSTECYNCYSTDHKSHNCPNEKACVVCKTSGHEPGSPLCPFYTHKLENLRPYGGSKDPLSNHFKTEHKFEFSHVSAYTADNHYFYQKGMKCGQEELALLCLNANTGAKAKYLGKGIRCTKDWDESELALNIMKEIKLAQFEQVKEFRQAMEWAHSNNKYMVEAVPTRDHFWGSGLDTESTLHTEPDHWPGKNTMGQILNQIAIEKFGPFWSEGEPGAVKGLTDDEDNIQTDTSNNNTVEEDEESMNGTIVDAEGQTEPKVEPSKPSVSQTDGEGDSEPKVEPENLSSSTNSVNTDSCTNAMSSDTKSQPTVVQDNVSEKPSDDMPLPMVEPGLSAEETQERIAILVAEGKIKSKQMVQGPQMSKLLGQQSSSGRSRSKTKSQVSNRKSKQSSPRSSSVKRRGSTSPPESQKLKQKKSNGMENGTPKHKDGNTKVS